MVISKAFLIAAFVATLSVVVTDWLGYTEVGPKIMCIGHAACGPR